jgi:antitoxin component YwqK of YwqJK toxin-antitoxin module
VKRSQYRAGRPEGFSVEYYPTGKVHTRAQFKGGKLEGEFVEFAEGGKVVQRIFYKEGKPQPAPPPRR